LQGKEEYRGSRVKEEGTEIDIFMAVPQLNRCTMWMTDNCNHEKKCRCTYYGLSNFRAVKTQRSLLSDFLHPNFMSISFIFKNLCNMLIKEPIKIWSMMEFSYSDN
jgi:hypothetical protein